MELVQLCIDLNVVLSRAYIKPNYNSFIYFITAILTKFYGYKYNPIKQYYINIFNIYEFSMPRQKNGEQKAILLKALMKTMHHSGYHHNIPIKTTALDAQGARSSVNVTL